MPRSNKCRYCNKKGFKKRTRAKTRRASRRSSQSRQSNSYLFNGGSPNVYDINSNIGSKIDPIDPSVQISARNLPKIGGGSCNYKIKNRSKKMRGGGMTDFLLGNNTSQPLAFGTSGSSVFNSNILSGTLFTNPATHIQPTHQMFSSNNPPLV